jgi:hypothetical protein
VRFAVAAVVSVSGGVDRRVLRLLRAGPARSAALVAVDTRDDDLYAGGTPTATAGGFGMRVKVGVSWAFCPAHRLPTTTPATVRRHPAAT